MNRYTQYCTRCHFTVYPGEGQRQASGTVHSDCSEAVRDTTIRRDLNPRIAKMYGQVNRKKLRKMLEEYPTNTK